MSELHPFHQDLLDTVSGAVKKYATEAPGWPRVREAADRFRPYSDEMLDSSGNWVPCGGTPLSGLEPLPYAIEKQLDWVWETYAEEDWIARLKAFGTICKEFAWTIYGGPSPQCEVAYVETLLDALDITDAPEGAWQDVIAALGRVKEEVADECRRHLQAVHAARQLSPPKLPPGL